MHSFRVFPTTYKLTRVCPSTRKYLQVGCFVGDLLGDKITHIQSEVPRLLCRLGVCTISGNGLTFNVRSVAYLLGIARLWVGLSALTPGPKARSIYGWTAYGETWNSETCAAGQPVLAV